MVFNKISGIYKIINIITNEFYIGSALNLTKRKGNHFDSLSRGCHPNIHLQRVYDKYGKENLRFEVLLICDKEYLIYFEQVCLDGLHPQYNIQRVAQSLLGSKRSQESIDKQKKTIAFRGMWNPRPKGTKMPKEFGDLVRKSKVGKPMSDEQKEAIRQGQIKRYSNPENKAKASAIVKRGWEKRKNVTI